MVLVKILMVVFKKKVILMSKIAVQGKIYELF